MRASVCILPGIFSGNRTTSKFRSLLQKSGYHITNDASKADIIIAHSAGCLWVPPLLDHQRLVIINPPYWPGKTIRERGKARSRSNLRFRQYGYTLRQWLTRQLWGIYYMLAEYARARHIIRQMPFYNLEAVVTTGSVLLVRNKHDDWLTPELGELQYRNPRLKIVQLPGDHDDFNYNPQTYVDLLQSEYKE